MTIEIGIAIEIAIENGAISKRFDNDPDFDLESPRSSVLHRPQVGLQPDKARTNAGVGLKTYRWR
jgi:hypothetical protein